MTQVHRYQITTVWQGNKGKGTSHVKAYDRRHSVSIEGKPSLELTTDNPLVGDKTKLNPEDLFVSAISSCHMLSYLYVCAMEGIVITEYSDEATGIMIEKEEGGGSFKEVILNPLCKVAHASMIERAYELHHKAHDICYIANSVNFEVKCMPTISS
jgi:organic hydroperoxide reductase OsmC/OhrA